MLVSNALLPVWIKSKSKRGMSTSSQRRAKRLGYSRKEIDKHTEGKGQTDKCQEECDALSLLLIYGGSIKGSVY